MFQRSKTGISGSLEALAHSSIILIKDLVLAVGILLVNGAILQVIGKTTLKLASKILPSVIFKNIPPQIAGPFVANFLLVKATNYLARQIIAHHEFAATNVHTKIERLRNNRPDVIMNLEVISKRGAKDLDLKDSEFLHLNDALHIELSDLLNTHSKHSQTAQQHHAHQAMYTPLGEVPGQLGLVTSLLLVDRIKPDLTTRSLPPYVIAGTGAFVGWMIHSALVAASAESGTTKDAVPESNTSEQLEKICSLAIP